MVHNGIIENHASLREELESLGYEFASATDTEVIVHLMHAHLEDTLSLEQLSAGTGVPAWTIRRLFRRHLRVTPSAYYRNVRLHGRFYPPRLSR